MKELKTHTTTIRAKEKDFILLQENGISIQKFFDAALKIYKFINSLRLFKK